MGRVKSFWWADFLYGLIIFGGLFFSLIFNFQGDTFFVIGATLGYFFRVVERMVMFDDALAEVVQEEVEETAEDHVPEQVEEEVGKQVEKEVPEQVEQEVQEQVKESNNGSN